MGWQEEDQGDDNGMKRIRADEKGGCQRRDGDDDPQRQPQIAASDFERRFSQGRLA